MLNPQTQHPSVLEAAAPLSLLDRIAEEQAVSQAQVASRYQPVMPIEEAIKRQEVLQIFMRKLLVDGIDYGKIPGTPPDSKPVLLKPGAEKVMAFFGYVPMYQVKDIEDWTGAKYGEPLFYYRYMCSLEKDGAVVGTGEGSANSWESKYRYRWQAEPPKGVDKASLLSRDAGLIEPDFAINKAETTGKYGKPKEYWDAFKTAIKNGTAKRVQKEKKDGSNMAAWEIGGTMYRVPNPDFADVINTCQKMGQKRAMIAAVLTATGLSQYFTQDLEDDAPTELPIEETPAPAPTKRTMGEKKLEGRTQADPPPQQAAPAPAPAPATAPRPATPAVPDAITAMWGRMTTVATVCSEFEALKRAISQFSGADQAYYDILGRHGMSHANDCRAVGMTKTRQAAREIFETIARWQGANQPPAVSPITDDRDTWVPEFDSPAPLNPAVAMTAEMRDRLAGKVA
jgi:hypothetical protein